MTEFFLLADSRTKFASEAKPFTVDLKSWLRTYWIAGRANNSGDFVRAPSVPGFAYQAGANGEAGPTEPAWPRVIGGTVIDGSITWTAQAPGTNAQDGISSVAWTQINPPDATLTIPAPQQTNTKEEATAQFVGGTAGQTYLIDCAMTTTAGNVYHTQFNLEVA